MNRTSKRVWLPFTDQMLVAVISVAFIFAIWQLISSPSFMLTGAIIMRIETDEKIVALTLDDGPLPVHTDEVVQLLADADIKATFFVIGKDAEQHTSELRSIVDAGHAVGNHSYTHTAMIFMPPALVAHEIEATDAVIRASGYAGTIPFRVPYNLKFVALPLYLARHDRPDISRDVLVQEGTERTADAIAAEVVEKVRPGSVVLLHPMYDHTASSRAAIPLIVQELKDQGYQFVTIPELLESAGH